MAQFFRYPAGATVSISAIGTNGAVAPTSSIEVAGINPSGNLQPLKTDAAGALLTTDSVPNVPKHVIVDSSALPAGASTSALQTTGNTSLSSIDGKTPALGQALATASVPVVLTAAQLTTLTPLTSVTVTQATGTNLHTVVDSGSIAVSNFPATQPVSGTVTVTQATGTNLHTVVDASALPTGAATDATLAAMSAKLPATLGQTTKAGSVSVAIASDQGAISTSQPDAATSGTITTQNLNPNTGVATTNSTVSTGVMNAVGAVGIQVTGTYTGALTPQVSVDGVNWIAVGAIQNIATGALSTTIPSATQGIFICDVAGNQLFRLSANAAVTGTATVTLRASVRDALGGIDAPLPAGANIIGALTANQTVNAAQINGVAPLVGNGVTGTGSQRVTIASDNSPISTKVGGSAVANQPIRNDYTVTAVTTGAYVQLVASTTAACNQIQVFDSSGQTMALATGGAGSEVIQCYIFPGGNGPIPLAIASGVRVSVKAISATASVGEIDINFFS